MTFRVHRVCGVCGRPESPRRRLVTIPMLLRMIPAASGLADYAMPETYCLNRRCVVKATFRLALAKLKEMQHRAT